MERHQAGQEDRLMEVQIGMEVVRQPRASPVNRHACLKCMVALATAMGLVIVALVAGFVLQYFVFAPSCNQVRNA